MVTLKNKTNGILPVVIILGLLLLGGIGCEQKLPETVSSCQPEFGSDTTYTGGLAGIVLTPGGECTFQIDQENSRRFNFRGWLSTANNQTVEFRIYVDQLAMVDKVELLNGNDLQNWGSFFEIEDFVLSNWKFKDPCYYGWIRYVFDPIGQRVLIDRSGLVEIPSGWEGCDRGIGNLLCFIRSYRDDYGHWRPSIQVVN
ncbi:MAG TPA: hypothetical protein PLF13_11485 [candidate division Zixibacteria bacterium]|nr:hypothetical protein [candidate division Zixibacteria bacterium]